MIRRSYSSHLVGGVAERAVHLPASILAFKLTHSHLSVISHLVPVAERVVLTAWQVQVGRPYLLRAPSLATWWEAKMCALNNASRDKALHPSGRLVLAFCWLSLRNVPLGCLAAPVKLFEGLGAN